MFPQRLEYFSWDGSAVLPYLSLVLQGDESQSMPDLGCTAGNEHFPSKLLKKRLGRLWINFVIHICRYILHLSEVEKFPLIYNSEQVFRIRDVLYPYHITLKHSGNILIFIVKYNIPFFLQSKENVYIYFQIVTLHLKISYLLFWKKEIINYTKNRMYYVYEKCNLVLKIFQIYKSIDFILLLYCFREQNLKYIQFDKYS